MNVFIGGYGACSVHNEKYIIINAFMDKGYNIISDYTKADLIILTDMCIGSGENVNNVFKYLIKVLKEKKPETKVILSGCLSYGFKDKLNAELQNILSHVIIIPTDKLIKCLFDNYSLYESEIEKEEQLFPFTEKNYHGIRISPVSGCLNSCSFCKTNYMNFALKSYPFDVLEKEIKSLDDDPFINYISIFSSNFSLYGVDLYGKQLAHKVMRLFNSNENIKYLRVGAIINWYPELLKEILDNPKVKQIDSSLETGSPRLYELMNRPISLEKWIETIKTIRQNRADILISTEIISGFPTETIDDIKMTIDLIQELRLYTDFIFPYEDFKKIPSSKLPQHSMQYNVLSERYVWGNLNRLNNELDSEIDNGEMYIVDKYVNEHCYRVLLTNGAEKLISFNCFDKEYEVGDFVTKGTVKNKAYVKRLERLKK